MYFLSIFENIICSSFEWIFPNRKGNSECFGHAFLISACSSVDTNSWSQFHLDQKLHSVRRRIAPTGIMSSGLCLFVTSSHWAYELSVFCSAENNHIRIILESFSAPRMKLYRVEDQGQMNYSIWWTSCVMNWGNLIHRLKQTLLTGAILFVESILAVSVAIAQVCLGNAGSIGT